MPKLILTYTLADVKSLIIADAAKNGYTVCPNDILAYTFISGCTPADNEDILRIKIRQTLDN